MQKTTFCRSERPRKSVHAFVNHTRLTDHLLSCVAGGNAGASANPTLSALPNHLPTLSTQELEQIMELQRRLSSEMSAGDQAQLPVSFFTNFAPEVRSLDSEAEALCRWLAIGCPRRQPTVLGGNFLLNQMMTLSSRGCRSCRKTGHRKT